MKKIIFIFIIFSFHSSVQADEYKFQSGDYVDLFIYNEPELCGEFLIHADGFIRLPLIGKVHVSGQTEDELNKSILSSISVYIKNPHITIAPKFSVSVMGYVEKPGVFTISDSDRIIEVIARAGGFTPEASGSISIYRDDRVINISKNKIFEKNTVLSFAKPGDVINAKRKLFTRGDYSIILSTLSVISLVLYYSTR
ncbi:polysaccharide biosynthesis/export family protein [Candidatus Omnitrophota bacterium]